MFLPKRPVALIRVATEAEFVRLRALANRTALRAVMAAIALLFLLGALVFAHVAAWVWLDRSSLASAAILGGADLLLAVIFGLLASRATPGAVEIEAIAVRRKALAGIAGEVALVRLVIMLLRLWGRMKRTPGS